MVTPKNKVTKDVAWCPVSHGVSLKGVFDCSKSAKTASQFFKASKNSFWLSSIDNWGYRDNLKPVNFFLQTDFKRTKTPTSKNQPTKQK